MEHAVTSPELMQSIHSMNLALEEVRKLAENLNNTVPSLASDIKGTLEDSRKLVQNFEQSASLQARHREGGRCDPCSHGAGREDIRRRGSVRLEGFARDEPDVPDPRGHLGRCRIAARPFRLSQSSPEALLRGKGE